LKNFFNILSNSYNVNKEVFISSVEAKDYPIWGSQFHPEKNPFEWRVPANHGLNAIMGS
jgi:gamma-glutamyl hydrolase